MAIKNYSVKVSRTYIIEIDDKADDEFVKLEALSMFNRELQFGLITANRDDFNLEIIGKDD
jgi:hypothetical protein